MKTNALWRLAARFVAPKVRCYSDKPEIDCMDAQTGWIPLRAYIELLRYGWNIGELQRTLSFLTIGIVGTIINLFFLYIFTPYTGSEIAGVLSTLITILTNFAMNDVITFRDSKGRELWERFVGYVAVGIVGKILQIILYVLLDLFINEYIAMIVAITITYVFRFFTIRDKVYNTG